MKRYAIREAFLTLQGEGARTGHKSYFVRFAGCNLWNGRPEDRDKGTGDCAQWCDTDFAKGTPQTAEQIIEQADAAWPAREGELRWFVFTGGEPMLQVDQALIEAAHRAGWLVAIETNGTIEVLDSIDWITVSPKRGSTLVQQHGDELKVVLPGTYGGEGWTDAELELMRQSADGWRHCFVQPQDAILQSAVEQTYLKRSLLGAEREFKHNLKRCIDFVLRCPHWALSFQVHKITGLR